jgi:phosphoribosyl 1,2-cyclic phosphodiesterase
MDASGAVILTIWGAGGSAPAAGSQRAVFGGETVCFGLSREGDAGGPHLLVDLGSGAREAGRAIAQAARLSGRPALVEVLLSHLHLDHIMGAPFFEPFYRADAQVTLHCGLFDDAEAFAARMKGLIAPPWFPVEPLKMAAARFAALPVRAPFEAAGFTVTAVPLHHPGGCMGFRIEGPDWSVAIIGDHEHGRPDTDAAARDLAQGATVMIYDATYDDAAYRTHIGWGHSTWQQGVALARAAGVGATLLHHHLPEHDDAALGRIDAEVRAANGAVRLARQGMRLRLSGGRAERI